MKIIDNINPWVGIWPSFILILIFNTLRHGGYLAVLHHIEASIEMGLAILLTLWFAWQIPYRIIKRKRMT